MGGGQINALIIEALGLDVGEILAVLAAGDEEKESGMVPVQCFVSRFDVQDGVMMTRALVLETSDSTVTGSGTIDLGQETLDLTLLAHPKDASVLSRQHAGRHQGHISRSADRRGLGGIGGEGAGRPRAGRRVAGDRRNSPVHRDRRGGRRQLRGAHERGPGSSRCPASASERKALGRRLSMRRFARPATPPGGPADGPGTEDPSGSSIGCCGDTGVSPRHAEGPFRLTLTASLSFEYDLTKLLPGTAKCADEAGAARSKASTPGRW